jgi:hypothetical protein
MKDVSASFRALYAPGGMDPGLPLCGGVMPKKPSDTKQRHVPSPTPCIVAYCFSFL